MELTTLLIKSFDLLRNQPKLAIPFILNQFVFYLLLFVVFSISFSSSFEISNINDLKTNGFYFLLGLFSWFFISTLFSSWGYYQNTQFIKDKNITLYKSALFSLKYIVKLFLVRLTYFIIVLIPVLLLVLLASSLFLINILLGVVGVLLVSALLIIWVLFISVRLLYAEASIYIDNSIKLSPFYYVKKAYQFSRKRSGSIILLVLTIIVIHAFVNVLTSNPFTSVVLTFLKSYQLFLYYALASLFSLILAIISGATSAFTNILILKSYRNFKKDNKNKIV